MMYEATSFECSRIAQDLQIRKVQVETVVQLLNEGNTVPFIANFRKEKSGGLEEDTLRLIQTRLNFVKQLNDRKQTILKSIETHGKLTEELRREILNAPTVRRLEDLYLPFKPRKKALANAARDKGLEPLALAIWHSDPAVGNLDELWPSLVNPEKQLTTVDDVKTGVQHLIAEMINETAEVRAVTRRVLWKASAVTATRNEKVPEGHGNEYKPYFQFKEATQEIRPHRILALNRGEKDGVLKVKLEWPFEQLQAAARTALAEHLLKIAGTIPPSPSGRGLGGEGGPPEANSASAAPAAPVADASGSVDAPSVPTEAASPAPETPPPETPPPAPPESPPAPPPTEVPPTAPPPQEPTPPGNPPAPPPPPTGTPPAPMAAPLVESIRSETAPVLTGEPLVEGMEFRSPHAAYLKACLDDALSRLLLPNLEREIRSELTDEAELHATKVLAHNLRSLLMQPPLVGKRVLGIAPGFRNGCKLAALDEAGLLLEHTTVHPHGGSGGGRKGKEKKPPAPTPVSQSSAEQTQPAPVMAAAESPVADAPAAPGAPSMEVPIASPEVAAATTPTPEMAPFVDSTSTPAVAVAEPEAPPAAAPLEPPVQVEAAAAETVVDKRAEAKARIEEFIKKHNLNLIALGNGPACRETEEVIAEVIAGGFPELSYVIVSEAGAGAYAVSPTAKEDLPGIDASGRTAASIGRRLQDPLSELVKIDPQALGAALTHHDVNRKETKETLEGVIESCVNQVGVDVNAAGVTLLRHVSGLNPMLAREIIEYRKGHGPYTSREQIAALPGMNPTRYAQAAGFLRVGGAPNPLDRVRVHPESYGVADKVFAELGFAPSALDDKSAHAEFRKKLNEVDLEPLAQKLDVGVPTLDAMFHGLAKPGKDPREDMPPPIFKKGLLKLEDLQPSQELKGVVLNVVDFGAFVDVGLKESGLVHISQMANKYIKSPYDVVSVNDIVTVWVLKIDKESNHVSLTMIKPGSERKPGERAAPPPPRREGEALPREGQPREGQAREERGQRPPPRGRGPGGPPREGQRPGGRPQQQRDRRPPPRGNEPREVLPPTPRTPSKPKPMPKLTQAAKEGKAPLRTLGELAAFFAAKEEKDKPAPPVVEEKKEPPLEEKPPESPSSEAPPA